MSELSVNERLQRIENELDQLRKKEKLQEPKGKEQKEKKPRQKTAYNIFMSQYISEQKEILGSDFKHKEAFASGAKKWQEQKNLN